MAQQFDEIFNGKTLGKLRVGPQGIAWKPLEGDTEAQSVMIQAGDVKWSEWLRVARNFQLRVGLKEKGKRVSFDGFLKEVRTMWLVAIIHLLKRTK